MIVRTRSVLALALGLLVVAAAACSLGGADPTGTPAVARMMPELPGYRVVEGKAVQEYIADLAEGAALLAMNPQMLLLIEKADRVITCYQEVGAVSMRVYSDEASPLSSGAIAIADRNRLADPATLFRCVGGQVLPFSSQASLNPCAHSYTLQRDDNEFYVVYIGTTQEICQAFCENLDGCAGY